MIESEWFVVVEVGRLEEEEEGIICPAILRLWYHVKVLALYFLYIKILQRWNIYIGTRIERGTAITNYTDISN